MSCLQGNDFPLGIRSQTLAQQIQIVSSLIFCVVLLFPSIRRFTNEGAQRLNKALRAELYIVPEATRKLCSESRTERELVVCAI